jgi:hypothetical protein
MSTDAMIKTGFAIAAGAIAGYLIYTNWDNITNAVQGARDAMKQAAGIRVDVQSNTALIGARKAVAEAKTTKEQIFAYQKLDKATTKADADTKAHALGMAAVKAFNIVFGPLGQKVRDSFGGGGLQNLMPPPLGPQDQADPLHPSESSTPEPAPDLTAPAGKLDNAPSPSP